MNHRHFPAGATALLALAPWAASAAAPAITSFTPSTGPLGTSVTITGTGFTGASSVTFDGTAASFSVKSATQIVATVPATGTGPISVTAAGATGASTAAFTLSPGLETSPNSGHESLAVTVIGAGFAPYTAADVYFDTTDIALAVSNSLGVISIPFQVPITAQPGGHWVTLVARVSGIAAQHSFTVNNNWSMQGNTPSGLGFNPYENTLFNGDVGQLAAFWTQPDGGFANVSPIIEENGTIVTGTVLGQIYAYSATGTLLWTAAPAGADFQSISPAANASLVFFASGTAVYAYKLACGTNGAVCPPTWTATLPASAAAGLTLNQNVLYVPASDGNIYPLNTATGAVGAAFAGYGSSGAATTQVAFAVDGSFFYAEGDKFEYGYPAGGSGSVAYSAALSAPVVSAGRVYFTLASGTIQRFGGWSAATSGTNCYPAPVVAGHYVYAGGCSSIGAFEAGTGQLEWSVTTTGQVFGLSAANGVLYGCVENNFQGELVAYDALYGSLLWTGGACTSAPVVANGNVYAALAELTAYSLPGLSSTFARPKPPVYSLKPNPALQARRTPEVLPAAADTARE
jgi:hypothetical protein